MANRKNPIETGRIGGLIRGRAQRETAVKRYLADPKLCERCGKPIPLKHNPSWTRQRRFCGRICATRATAPKRVKHQGKELFSERTKQDVLEGRHSSKSYWQGQHYIRQHARRLYLKSGLPMKCAVCGYDKHVEICHRKSVSDFPNTALIAEINAIENLSALCRNHHWELEHGLLKLSQS